MPNRYSLAEGRQIAPYHRAPRLGPRAFNISVLTHGGTGTEGVAPHPHPIGVPFIATPKNSKFPNVSTLKPNRAAALAEWRQLLSA